MVKQEFVNRMNAHLDEVLARHGVPLGTAAFRSIADASAAVELEKDFANAHADALTAAFADFVATMDGLDPEDQPADSYEGVPIKGIDTRIFVVSVAKPNWIEDPSDDEYWENQERLETDEDYRMEVALKNEEKMRKVYEDYLIPIPPAPARATGQVFLTLAHALYDAIERGEKKIEYREYKESWVKKLLASPLSSVKFQRGYGGPGRGKPAQMVVAVKGVHLAEYDRDVTCDPRNVTPGFLPAYIGIELGERIS